MSTYPLHFTKDTGPPEILDLVQRLVPQLLAGNHPTLAALRRQFAFAEVGAIELSGAGFFVELVVPRDLPPVEPARLVGGDASLTLSDAPGGGGCVVIVDHGYLSTFEGYTYAEPWTVHTRVLAVERVTPLIV